MKDAFGRTIDYMRISITDRCNLRCKYCMPNGVEQIQRCQILSLEEIRAIAAAGAAIGIRYIKVTGGEPLVRQDCCQLISMLKSIPGIEKVTLTTNGVLLDQYLESLLEAGIDGINVSLDTLNEEQYQNITGRDELKTVLKAIRNAAATGISVKVNAVSIRLEEDGWKSLIQLAKDTQVDVRFIEMMPIGYGRQFEGLNHLELLEEMKREYPGMQKDYRVHGHGPAVYYHIPGFLGSIGFISATHGKFCSQCNRIRITSQGYLKSCLCYDDGADLRAVLREETKRYKKKAEGQWNYRWPEGFDTMDSQLQAHLQAAMKKAIYHKPVSHCFEQPGEITEKRNMVEIGG